MHRVYLDCISMLSCLKGDLYGSLQNAAELEKEKYVLKVSDKLTVVEKNFGRSLIVEDSCQLGSGKIALLLLLILQAGNAREGCQSALRVVPDKRASHFPSHVVIVVVGSRCHSVT